MCLALILPVSSLRSPRSSSWQPLRLLAQGVRLCRDPQMRRWGLWVGGMSGAIALLMWNSQLVLATSSGAGFMWWVYWWQQGRWQRSLRQIERLLAGPQQSLVVAVASGGGVAIATYFAIALWLNTENHWLAAQEISQGVAIWAILAYLLIQQSQQHRRRATHQYDRLIWALTHPNPVKRLFALHKLSQTHRDYSRSQRQHLRDYLHLLLTEEQHPRVQPAILTLLQALNTPNPPALDAPPVKIPLHLKQPVREFHNP